MASLQVIQHDQIQDQHQEKELLLFMSHCLTVHQNIFDPITRFLTIIPKSDTIPIYFLISYSANNTTLPVYYLIRLSNDKTTRITPISILSPQNLPLSFIPYGVTRILLIPASTTTTTHGCQDIVLLNHWPCIPRPVDDAENKKNTHSFSSLLLLYPPFYKSRLYHWSRTRERWPTLHPDGKVAPPSALFAYPGYSRIVSLNTLRINTLFTTIRRLQLPFELYPLTLPSPINSLLYVEDHAARVSTGIYRDLELVTQYDHLWGLCARHPTTKRVQICSMFLEEEEGDAEQEWYRREGAIPLHVLLSEDGC